jgi:hypothetical protein
MGWDARQEKVMTDGAGSMLFLLHYKEHDKLEKGSIALRLTRAKERPVSQMVRELTQ